MSTYKPVQRILKQGGDGLQPLLERAHYLHQLTELLRRQLDNELGVHLSVANLRERTAVICADSPAWLARIRYLAPLLLQHLQQQPGLEHIHKIQFKVQPAETPAASPPARTTRLSSASAEVIHSAASGITDSELASALERLSQRSQGRNKPAK